MKRIQISYCCNDKLFKGLYLSILSILRRTKSNIDFYIISADLTYISRSYKIISKEHINDLKKLVKSFNPKNTLQLIDCTSIWKSKTKKIKVRKTFHTPFCSFRLLIEDFKQISGKLIYLDVDTLANNDIKSLYDIELNGFEIGACHDKIFYKKNGGKYFNSGVLLLNVDLIRKTHLLSRALNYLFKVRPLYSDQDALNAVSKKIKFLPGEYKFNYPFLKLKNDTVIKHFMCFPHANFLAINVKPWEHKKVRKILRLHNWDKDYEIWLNHFGE